MKSDRKNVFKNIYLLSWETFKLTVRGLSRPAFSSTWVKLYKLGFRLTLLPLQDSARNSTNDGRDTHLPSPFSFFMAVNTREPHSSSSLPHTHGGLGGSGPPSSPSPCPGLPAWPGSCHARLRGEAVASSTLFLALWGVFQKERIP